MKEQLITFETAKLAKEKGFKKESFNYYNEKGELLYDNEFNSFGSFQGTKLDNYIDAPTQSLLQKWLREEHNCIIEIIMHSDENNNKEQFECKEDFLYACEVDYYGKNFKVPQQDNADIQLSYFKTYEEALERALQSSLKLIK